MTRSALALLCSALALPVTAQTIYKCTDANGGVVIANSRVEKNCKAVQSGPESTLPAPKRKASSTPTPASFPKVEEDTQKARDGDRRYILEQELDAEQRSLERSRKNLTEQERTVGNQPDRLTPYKDSVAQHERNIQAIQKELGNLR